MNSKIIFALLVFASLFMCTNVKANTLDNGNDYHVLLTANDGDKEYVGENFCEGIAPGLKIVGYIIIVVKVFVPLLIACMAIKDFYEAVISGKDSDLKKQAFMVGKRIILGLIIFFIPTIVKILINTINYDENSAFKYEDCAKCLFEPGSC